MRERTRAPCRQELECFALFARERSAQELPQEERLPRIDPEGDECLYVSFYESILEKLSFLLLLLRGGDL